MKIYTLHGIVDQFEQEKQTCRNYISHESLQAYLANRKDIFVAWEEFETEGDVITVDDATKAGADACKLLRSFGHEVIFFVNPWQIMMGTPYFFSLLDILIDDRKVQHIHFDGEFYDLNKRPELQKFRKVCKKILMMMPPSDAADYCQSTIAETLQVSSFSIPEHLRPTTLNELLELKSSGVRIESHGWSHRSIVSFTVDQHVDDIRQTSEWFSKELLIHTTLYAVPFGYPAVDKRVQAKMPESCFLLDPEQPNGYVGDRCWNRLDLNDEIKKLPA